MRSLLYFALALLFSVAPVSAGPATYVVGDVRVQLLSDTLLRLEVKGPAGFEDRATFHVAGRDWPGAVGTVQTKDNVVEIRTDHYLVRVPENASSLANVTVLSKNGTTLYQFDGRLENSRWLPSPGDKPQAWWFADTPRIVPPAWGLTPPPQPTANGGWDLGNDVPDIYVFVPQGDYFTLRKDFLKLTGPTVMPPLFLFGGFDSRWYDYSETTALQQIEEYRKRKIPLDVLVVDTGWRMGASTGYQANSKLFPDLPRFFAAAHAKNVKVMFNDHPEPVDVHAPALNDRELDFRFGGLVGLLNQGLDIWWYDRNWTVALISPAPNLCKEVWGMRIYHDTVARVRPEQRPLIMANVDGIDNGICRRPMNVTAHRYTCQWTGDTGSDWKFLRGGVENAVHAGVNAAFPYMSEDLGGHLTNPTAEQYIRWIEYGALSPVYRPHCTMKQMRMPWVFGAEAEAIARNYLNMRYRLLPVFYAAARENYETGEPLLRRLDLAYPDLPEARRDDEYLLGRFILVAPVLQGSEAGTTPPVSRREVWIPPGEWIDLWNGETVTGPLLVTRNVALNQIPMFVKSGAVLPLAPEMQFTYEKPWNPITLDLYPSVGDTIAGSLYEDDTVSTAYHRGAFRNTSLKLSADDHNKTVQVGIGAVTGEFEGALKERSWKLRIHVPKAWGLNLAPSAVRVNGAVIPLPVSSVARNTAATPFGDPAGAPDANVFEIVLPPALAAQEQVVQISFNEQARR